MRRDRRKPLSPFDILNQLFQYSLVRSYAPIVGRLGFSHPLTFAVITAHNTFSLTYLLLTAAFAYAILRRKTWLLPFAIVIVWTLVSVSVVAELNIPTITAVAAVLPHGWLEFAALAYWINAIRKATQSHSVPVPASPPTLRDYFRALRSSAGFLEVLKTDFKVSFSNTKHMITALFRTVRRAYATTLVLIALAAFLETYLTPSIMLLIDKL